MVEDLKIKQFEKFYYFLMDKSPEGYKPWFFPCKKLGKDPSPEAILKIDGSSKGSWHHESARLNKEQVIEHIKQGYNIGLSARTGDPLIIIDIDSEEYLIQIPPNTLTARSRKRAGLHAFCWDKDGTAKINLPTDYGEVRSDNQYVLCCGSYVPFNLENEKEKKAFNNLPREAQEDKLLGFYTIEESEFPRAISFNELPKIFRDKESENIKAEAEIKNKNETKEIKGEGKYTELFNLKVSDIVGLIPANKRNGHPLHESDTDANFSLSKDGSIAHCWRHLVSLNAVQYLCVKAGYKSCVDCGTPHKGRGISKIKGDKEAYEVAYKEAVKLGLIKEYVKKEKKKEQKLRISSYVFEKEKIIVEQIYINGKSLFCVYDDNTGETKIMQDFKINGKTYYPQEGEEIIKGAIFLPSNVEDYIDDVTLDKKINSFIYKWLDVPNEFKQFGLWNIKRSWVFQKFHTLNYLRFLGDTGTGKSRGLDVFGLLHYKPIKTSGSTSPPALFRIIDKWRGTIIMDEADLKQSDETADIIKVINQGFEKGSHIMRCDQNDSNLINFFDPYCPKLLGTRKSFTDKATESRCVTHVCEATSRKDIPLNLNKDFFEEAQIIRNMLLMWRFKNYFKIDCSTPVDFGDLEPRVEQIVKSYVSLFGNDTEQMEKFKHYIKDYQIDLIEERQSSFDGAIVGAIYELIKSGHTNITSKNIIEKGGFTNKNGDRPMSPRALTSPLKSLGFGKSKLIRDNESTKRIIPLEQKHLNKIFTRYGFDCNDVTVVTVITETSNLNKIDKNSTIPDFLDKSVTVGGVSHVTVTTVTSLQNPEPEEPEKLLTNSINKDIITLESFTIPILKEKEVCNIYLEEGHKYPKSYLGDNADEVIKILEKEKKIRLEQK